MTEDSYCDRQGCLNTGYTLKKPNGQEIPLPDGCQVKVCDEHKPYFHNDPVIGTHDAEAEGVYWHRHILYRPTPEVDRPNIG